jgi:hypothetical protein
MTKPLFFLDVDGVLNTDPAALQREGLAVEVDARYSDLAAARVPGVQPFMEFILEHFDVRWLTSWCPSSATMSEAQYGALCWLTGVSVERLRAIPATRWRRNKAEGLGREAGERTDFLWIEDDRMEEEMQWLLERGLMENFLHCDCIADPLALGWAHALLQSRFGFDQPAGQDRAEPPEPPPIRRGANIRFTSCAARKPRPSGRGGIAAERCNRSSRSGV